MRLVGFQRESLRRRDSGRLWFSRMKREAIPPSIRTLVLLGVSALSIACSTRSHVADGSSVAADASPSVLDASEIADAGGPDARLDDPIPDGGGEVDHCAAFARIACRNDCPYGNWTPYYGSVVRCERSFVSSCRAQTSGGATLTPARIHQCAADVGCRVRGPLPPSCDYPPGTLAEGAPCTETSQCAALDGVQMFCARDFTSAGCTLGRCVPSLLAGEACDPTEFGRCAPPALCVQASGSGEARCVEPAYRAEGEECSHPLGLRCDFGLSCLEGRCVPSTREEGEPCDSTLQCAVGLECPVPLAGDVRVCRSTLRLIGEDCTSPYAYCPSRASACVDGVCIEDGGGAGAACQSSSDCLPHLSCRGGTCGEAPGCLAS